jgi:hypothetical protein
LLDEIKFPFIQKKLLDGTHKHIGPNFFIKKLLRNPNFTNNRQKKNSLKLVAAAHGDVGAADAGVADGSRVTAASGLRMTFVNP